MQLRHQLGRPFIEFVEIGVLQGVLVLGPTGSPADPDVLRHLKIEIGALNGASFGRSRAMIWSALAARFDRSFRLM